MVRLHIALIVRSTALFGLTKSGRSLGLDRQIFEEGGLCFLSMGF